jgi:hypothetical protein
MAGDLLNWVLQRRSENRAVVFTDAHRPGGAVLRRDGHQRACEGEGSHQLNLVGWTLAPNWRPYVF